MKASSLPALVLLAALIGCGSSREAEEAARQEEARKVAHTIQLKRFGAQGHGVEVRHNVHTKNAIEQIGSDRKLVSRKTTETGVEEVWIETVVEAGSPAPPKFKRQYSMARVEENGKKYQRTYKGRTLLYLLEDGYYKIVPLFGALTDESDLPYASAVADPPDYFTPPHAVHLGDTWPVDPGLKLAPNANLDRNKSKGEGTLTRVYDRDGKKFGVIDVKLNMVFGDGATTDIDLQYDGAIDGSSTWSSVTSTMHRVQETNHKDGTSTLTTIDMTVTTVHFDEKPPKGRPPEPEMPKEKEKPKEMMKDKDKEKPKEMMKVKDKEKPNEMMKVKDKEKDKAKVKES